MSVRASLLVALAVLLGVAQGCGSRPIDATDGGGDARADRSTSGAAGSGGMANAGTTGGAGSGAAGTGAGGTAGSGGGVAGSGVAGGGVAGNGGGAGTAGTAGAAGTTGSGGSAGATGRAGRGGGGGASGAAGGAGKGGASGAAGGAGKGGASGAAGGAGKGGAAGGAGKGGAPGPECMTASDCKLVSDCCTCEAIPVGDTAPLCSLVCIQSQCDARQLPRGAVACVAGRCVAGFACDASQVTCRRAPPTCPAGEVPSIDDAGTCYTGACAPATECTMLADCAACARADLSCVSYQTQRGPQFHCVTLPPACGGRANCDCLGASACVAPYRSCGNLSGLMGITCSCPNC